LANDPHLQIEQQTPTAANTNTSTIALGEAVADQVGDVVYEGTEGKGGNWGLRLGLQMGFGV
jgi:hypothetical protein